MIRLDDTITVNEDLMVADLDGEMVLLNTQSGTYFGLNEVGSRIWELASEPRMITDILDALANEYSVDQKQLEGDVLHFINSLFQRSLVHVVATVEV
ncbi:MAG: lasso peptide biosynthesis PqqD family chaperone [Rhodothermaceae bacterium]|nr:lasso peptide biosynthesis PqqD family chaperone [Rhodothermaceae bacterium]